MKPKLSYQRKYGPRAYTPKEKIHNCIWDFTIGDADDKPSVPHAHSREEGYRLNAWTGEIFPAGNDRTTAIDKIKTKDLKRLHKDGKFIEFAIKQISWYRVEHPSIGFFVPKW